MEDTIFATCISRIKKFPNYITNCNDIISQYGNQLVTKDFKKLNLDSVFRKSDDYLINIEHHSSINPHLMRRDYEYAVNLHYSTGNKVEPFIFYTGPLPVNKVSYLNKTMFFNPKWVITQEIDGNLRLNNILYKKDMGDEFHPNDILDCIWMPKFNIDMSKEDLILKLTEIYPHIHSKRYLLDTLRDCLIIWVGKYIKNQHDLEKIYKRLNMSALEIRTLEEEIRNARIVGEIERATEKGREEGKEEEKQKWISKEQKLKEEIIKILKNQNTDKTTADEIIRILENTE